jgi:uncharacterized protein YndB with AHSA1/START domain
MTNEETIVVEQTLRVAARPETVWRYWTDPERMREWWGQALLEPSPGGRCRVEMDQGPVMSGEFVELVPHERIVFTFGWEPMPDGPIVPPGSTVVEITLVDDDGDTIMTLRHRGLPAAHAAEHRSGWEHFLPLLAGAAGGAG